MVDSPNNAVDSLLASILLEETTDDDNATPSPSPSSIIITIFPTEIQKLILRHLDWPDLLHMRAANRNYRTIITSQISDVWKARHNARWVNGKRRTTWLTFKGSKLWSEKKHWTLHPEHEIGEADGWFDEFLRRSRLDRTVPLRLIALRAEEDRQPRTNNDTWYGLMVDGQDIVDCLKKIVVKRRDMSSKAWSTQVGFPPSSTLQVMGEKVLTGISRVVAYQEWKFLHDPCVEQYKLDDKIQLEDGAMAIAKFYESAEHIIDSHWIHDFAEAFTLKELDRLAGIIKNRLCIRSHAQVGSKYPILEVMEEMKFLFDNPDLRDDDGSPLAFRGNVDNYYDHHNSLISCCVNWKTGIPITLAVIYTSIVRRVCGVQMDIIGLPGHIVAGVPFNEGDNASRTFVDPFHEGKILSYANCQGIVARYNMTFHEDMVKPISNEQVWERMIRNLIHSHSMQALADDNDDESESNQEWRIAIPLRFLLSDYAHRIKNSRDLANAPGWCPQFC